jgi:hypothetical protein
VTGAAIAENAKARRSGAGLRISFRALFGKDPDFCQLRVGVVQFRHCERFPALLDAICIWPFGVPFPVRNAWM